MKVLFRLSILIAAITLGMSGAAFAVPCGAGGVSGSGDCQDGLSNNDKLSPTLTVNDEIFFGYADWVYLDKFDAPNSYDNDQAFDWTVTAADGAFPDDNGDWSFSAGVRDTFEDVMIVVKNKSFSGYLLNSILMPTSGTWNTGDTELSHLTLYARGDVPVPEPTTMLLLGAGLNGLAGFGRRKILKKINLKKTDKSSGRKTSLDRLRSVKD